LTELLRSFDTISLREINFDPAATFECGQCFRWRPLSQRKGEWIGTVGGAVLITTRSEVRLVGGKTSGSLEETVARYFSFQDDLQKIELSLPKDEFLECAMQEYAGLRVLTQDPWECLISFVCSINSNIPSIKAKIENLSRRYGTQIDSSFGGPAYSFPEPSALARAEKKGLLECKTGFRWRYIKFLARKVSSGELDLDKLGKMPYREAHDYLVSEVSRNTFGVGPKVADCVLLFSYHMLDSFPIDVWIARCIRNLYQRSLSIPEWNSLTPKRYQQISKIMRDRFGENSGYAQQYLYAKFRADEAHSKKRAGLNGRA
jgi:N-glycosylase/DNA lyase